MPAASADALRRKRRRRTRIPMEKDQMRARWKLILGAVAAVASSPGYAEEAPGSRAGNPDCGHAIVIAHTIPVAAQADTMAQFFLHLDEYYLQLSPGNRKFSVRGGGPLSKGSLIDDEEEAGGQYATHLYTVLSATDSGLTMLSNPSIVRSGDLTMAVPTRVRFDWKPAEGGGTILVGSRVELCFDSVLDRFVASRLGTEAIWQDHVVGEMQTAARLIAGDGSSRTP